VQLLLGTAGNSIVVYYYYADIFTTPDLLVLMAVVLFVVVMSASIVLISMLYPFAKRQYFNLHIEPVFSAIFNRAWSEPDCFGQEQFKNLLNSYIGKTNPASSS
jgi:hypothetical protein